MHFQTHPVFCKDYCDSRVRPRAHEDRLRPVHACVQRIWRSMLQVRRDLAYVRSPRYNGSVFCGYGTRSSGLGTVAACGSGRATAMHGRGGGCINAATLELLLECGDWGTRFATDSLVCNARVRPLFSGRKRIRESVNYVRMITEESYIISNSKFELA